MLVNAILIRRTIEGQELWAQLKPEDFRALTPLLMAVYRSVPAGAPFRLAMMRNNVRKLRPSTGAKRSARPGEADLDARIRSVVGDCGLFLIYENASPDVEDRDAWLRRWDQKRQNSAQRRGQRHRRSEQAQVAIRRLTVFPVRTMRWPISSRRPFHFRPARRGQLPRISWLCGLFCTVHIPCGNSC